MITVTFHLQEPIEFGGTLTKRPEITIDGIMERQRIELSGVLGAPSGVFVLREPSGERTFLVNARHVLTIELKETEPAGPAADFDWTLGHD